MAIPPELVDLICSFADPPTLVSLCLSNKSLCLNARAALYMEASFDSSHAVGRFLLHAPHHLKLVKRLYLYIPSFSEEETEAWSRLFVTVLRDSSLIVLRILSPNDDGDVSSEFQRLVGRMLAISTLKYVALTLSLAPLSVVVQCSALKELDILEEEEWDPADFERLQDQKPQLNTLCIAFVNRSTLPLTQFFNFGGLKRLAIDYNGTLSPILPLLEISCPTLEELSIWLYSTVSQAFFQELRQFAFPNLQIFTLFCSGTLVIREAWNACNLFSSGLVEISGPQFKELRIYLHYVLPDSILREEKLIPSVHPQIAVIRLYCYDSNPMPPRAAEAQSILHKRLGIGRDLRVIWGRNWTCLTRFGVPRPVPERAVL
ncbi:hypothetical protein DL96DRAFT_1609792 [Flagelloscypha sp. PMI_526]|nr:hypothetical protein DL96DRAFT_1609792 [Flagelloscypha sp. PMI_526]